MTIISFFSQKIEDIMITHHIFTEECHTFGWLRHIWARSIFSLDTVWLCWFLQQQNVEPNWLFISLLTQPLLQASCLLCRQLACCNDWSMDSQWPLENSRNCQRSQKPIIHCNISRIPRMHCSCRHPQSILRIANDTSHHVGTVKQSREVIACSLPHSFHELMNSLHTKPAEHHE